jgi:lactate dehydrogenase-like 2-hydroxyacid dehydrogenase
MTNEKADRLAKEVGSRNGRGIAAEDGRTFKVVREGELFQNSHVISLHYVLSARSRGVVGAQELGWTKPSGRLINTSHCTIFHKKGGCSYKGVK